MTYVWLVGMYCIVDDDGHDNSYDYETIIGVATDADKAKALAENLVRARYKILSEWEDAYQGGTYYSRNINKPYYPGKQVFIRRMELTQ